MFKYIFRPYDSKYPYIFDAEKKRLKTFLPNTVAIEHVGSTSIPGMGGKGIIDILVGVLDKKELASVSLQVQKAGYYFDPNDGTDERLFHGRKVSDSKRYHLHLTFIGSKDWNEMIAFRDYVKTHPDAFEKYATIKKEAVNEANQDHDMYMKIKQPVLAEIIKKATT